jgi:DNA-binding response OmpR family regulator
MHDVELGGPIVVPMATILIVEDDAGIRTSTSLALEAEGYRVVEAESTEAALELFSAASADLVLVDLTLPQRDGFDCIRSLRRGSDVPVIVVTARSDTHDVVAGLEAGADDYVTKPFAIKELSARIRAALRRTREQQPGLRSVRIGSHELRVEEGALLRDGEQVHLTKTEFRLLCELAEAPGRVLSREQLLERVWGYGYFGDGRLVDVHVSRLRAKLEDDPTDPQHLLTVRGLGYKLQL